MKKILFDIDHTLLNTTDMARNLSNLLVQETGLSKEEVEDYETIYTENLPHITYFDFIELVNTLPVNKNTKDNIIDRYENEPAIYTKYNTVDEVLKKLYAKGYKIGVFSEGTPHFQETKLKNLRIGAYLDKSLIFIGQSKRSDEFIEKLPASIIVDDNKDVCNILARHKKHKIIHLNIKHKEFTPENDDEISNSIVSIDELPELLDFI